MKKVEMVEEITYFCDICGIDITDSGVGVCSICGRDHCKTCHRTVKGSKDGLTSICPIYSGIYEKFKKQMDEHYCEYDDLYRQDVAEINDRWKKESLLIDNKGE